jgi:hypothetical protein
LYLTAFVGPVALDPCESAAQVFKCGVENSVIGMTNLIAAGAASGEIDAKVEFKVEINIS